MVVYQDTTYRILIVSITSQKSSLEFANILAMPLSFLLVLEVFSLILTSSEEDVTVVYYVTPTEPPNPDCPGQPCQTLEHYFSHKEEYFNSNKINVTMLLLGGEHVLSHPSTEYVDTMECNYTGHAHLIKDLETFEMIGLEPAQDVLIQLLPDILLMNITKSRFASLTFYAVNVTETVPSFIVGCALSANTRQLSEKTTPADNITFVVVVNQTIFSGVALCQLNSRLINFSTTVANSRFDNQSEFRSTDNSDLHLKKFYARELIVTNCTFNNSGFKLVYSSSNIRVFNSTLIVRGSPTGIGLRTINCNVEINGTVFFTNAGLDYDNWNPFTVTLFLTSNVTITGDVTFADSLCTPIAAYLSTITLSGKISFRNNTGVNGGAMTLYSSTLNIAPNTTVYFYNNTATETGGAIYVDNDRDKLASTAYTYFLLCFYQLLDYDVNSSNWYNISLYNNSASKGGDHIYGAFMHSSG